MRYIDQYVRIAAEKFERELARVALTDTQAKHYFENAGVKRILEDIKSGKLTPPSKAFEPYAWWFFPDSKYSEWASRLMYVEGEQDLFDASAGLSNILRYQNDVEFADYCQRLGYVFPDGWPNDQALYQKTVTQTDLDESKKVNQSHMSLLMRLSQFLSKK